MTTTTLPPIRRRMVANMKATVADEARNLTWTYYEFRPLAVPAGWGPGQRVHADCSKGAQFQAKWADAEDPFGMGFGVWGNSTSATSHLHHVDHPSELEEGDYVTFGPNGDAHMAVVYEAGTDPLLWSHGHQGAPEFYRLSHDRRERHYLLNPAPRKVVRPETPVEHLRARRGYWAWHQWRLGRGAWKKYGKRNARVRPDVPKRIPLRWWRRYAHHHLTQRRPNRSL